MERSLAVIGRGWEELKSGHITQILTNNEQLAKEHWECANPFCQAVSWFSPRWSGCLNGRSIREFNGQLAREAGYGIEWQGIRRKDMTRASIEAYEGDSSRMASLIRAGLRDMDREYALDLATAVAGDKAHIVMAIRGETYEGIVVGTT